MDYHPIRLLSATVATRRLNRLAVDSMCSERGQLANYAHPERRCGPDAPAAHPFHMHSPSGFQRASDQLDARAETIIHGQVLFHLVDRVNHRRVIAPAEQVPHLDE